MSTREQELAAIKARVDKVYEDEVVGQMYADVMYLLLDAGRLETALKWYAEDMNYLVEKVVYDKHGLPWYAYVAEGDVQERACKALAGDQP